VFVILQTVNTDDPDTTNTNKITIDFTSTPDPIRVSTTAIQSKTTNAALNSMLSAMTIVLQDVLLSFGMVNIAPEHRGQIWHCQRLGQYFDFDTSRVRSHTQLSGWEYLRHAISLYVCHSMGAMLLTEQQAMFQEDQHLQIYINTSDGGFSDVLHEPSYDQTFHDLAKYIQRDSINLIDFNVFITFFSPAFLDSITVPSIVHGGTRSVRSESAATTPVIIPLVPQAASNHCPHHDDSSDVLQPSKSVSWTPIEASSLETNPSPFPRPKHPMFQNVDPSAWTSPRPSQVRSNKPHHGGNMIASDSYPSGRRSPVEHQRVDGNVPNDSLFSSGHCSPIELQRGHTSIQDEMHGSRPGSPLDGTPAQALSVPIPLEIGYWTPRGPCEIYGSRFFIHDHLPFALRRYWQPEKVGLHALPSFVASTTGFRWYEACCDHLLSHGIYLPPYHCLKLNQPLGTSWEPLVQTFPEARDRLRPWSHVLRTMLQKLVDEKGVTHPVPGAAKFADIIALCDNDGYQAFYDIMEYHASQLNLPAVSNIKSHNIPRMKPTEHLKQFTYRFQEHLIQRYYRNGYNVQPPELYALYMDSLPPEIVRHFRVRIWTFKMDNCTSMDAWQVGNMDFCLLFDHIVKAILNECKMNGMHHLPTVTAPVRKPIPAAPKPFKIHALTDGVVQDSDEEVEELYTSAMDMLSRIWLVPSVLSTSPPRPASSVVHLIITSRNAFP
jgi:hypothetical protein